MGVSFSRCPGSWASSQKTPLSGGQSLWQQLVAHGADLFWQGSDGSSVQAHLQQYGYSQGNGLNDYCEDPKSAIGELKTLLGENQPSSPSPYVYLPCGNDFALPIPCLLQIAEAWNQQTPAPPTTVVVGTQEQYFKMVKSWSDTNPSGLVHRTMDPTPYWTGFYASRPENKILHHATVRALLGAEVFGMIANLLQVNDALAWAPVVATRQEAIAQGWESLLPSTHHDYITGTAVDSVYTEEQVPLLRAAESIAEGARSTAMQEIAPLIGANPGSGETPVAVFNQLGFSTTGLVEIPTRPGLNVKGVRSGKNSVGPVQTTHDGRLLFQASAPSLGYDTYYLSGKAPGTSSAVSAKISSDGKSVTMANSHMQLVLSKDQGWGITSLQPIVNNQPQPTMIPSGEAANYLTFYKDLGNIYNFGNEFNQNGFTVVTGQLTAGNAQVIENGPLMVRVQVPVTFRDGTSQAEYTIEYTLVAGEPLVGMRVTGSVPLPPDPNNPPSGSIPYAVTVRFPFTESGGAIAKVDGVLRGTPYHWFDKLPEVYWHGPTFQATHNFVVPSSGGTTLGALYHSDIPAWAIDDDGAMIGCILRNTPSVYPWPEAPVGRGANGADFWIHTHHYALRIPQGLEVSPPSLLGLFEESFSFKTPLRGAYINVPTEGVTPSRPVNVSFPTNFSLASVTSGNAILTVAKEGQYNSKAMILRLYQPSNTSQSVTVSLDDYTQATQDFSPKVVPVTALEGPIKNSQPFTVTNDQVTLTVERALTTLEVTQGTTGNKGERP